MKMTIQQGMRVWETVSLENVVVPGSHGLKRGPFGGAIKKDMFVANGYKIYEQKHAIYGDFQAGTYYVNEAKFQELKGFSIQTDDLLVSCSGTMGRISIVPESAHPGIINQALLRIRPDREKVLPVFLKRLLETPEIQKSLFGSLSGSAIKNVKPLDEIRSFKISLPPISEQKRIAAILDKAEELRSLRRKALGELDAIVQSIFLEMFGDPATNPKGWNIRKVSDYVSTFQGGKCIDAEDENTVTRNRIVKVSAVTSMVFRPEESKPLPDTYEPPVEHFVRPGDLLFSRANTTELVGAVAYVKSTPGNIVLADKVWRFVWKTPIVVEPLFVWVLFQTPAMRYEIGKRATGTSGSMKNISQPKTFGIPTILPPIELQQKFARRVEAIERLKTTHRESIAQLDALFASLQQRAFRGEL